jgi:hypothetical protein
MDQNISSIFSMDIYTQYVYCIIKTVDNIVRFLTLMANVCSVIAVVV